MQVERPTKEHAWLERFVGEWAYEHEAVVEPGKPSETFRGTESVRSLGGIWIMCEGRGAMPDGTPSVTIMTLGYDPTRSRFVGTFIGTMMQQMWIYEGTLNPEGTVLTLETEGPSFSGDGTTAKYIDTIEWKSADHRMLTSSYQEATGNYRQFMTAHYRRTR
jgi:Protein of unknown function (DUF1579)